MLREKIKETNVSSSNKWRVYNTMPIINIIILSARATLWKMARNKVIQFSTNKQVYQFQVACVSYLNLKQNKTLKEKNDTFSSTQFDSKKSAHMRKTFKHVSARAIDMIMFYKNMKSLIFKVLVYFAYCFINKYMCLLIISVFKEK